MKITFLKAAYPDYIRAFYGQRPELASQPYRAQKEALSLDAFNYCGSWESLLPRHGWEAEEFQYNIPPLQQAWLRERKSSNHRFNSLESVALAQVRESRPDVLYFGSHDSHLLAAIRDEVPTIRFVVGPVGSAVPPSDVWAKLDLILSCAPETVARFRAEGLDAELFSHSFDTRVTNHLDPAKQNIDCSFVGQVCQGAEYHGDREGLLEHLVRCSVDLQIFSPSFRFGAYSETQLGLKRALYYVARGARGAGIPEGVLESTPLIKKVLRYPCAPKSAANTILKPNLRPAVFGLKMHDVVHSSRVSLNMHANSSPTHASNMRIFEATGNASCLLTDWKPNISELFTPDFEIVTYRNAEECCEKLRYLLDHPAYCDEIAHAGQRRCLSDHTHEIRIELFDQIVRSKLSSKLCATVSR
jgi:hypothetical protein